MNILLKFIEWMAASRGPMRGAALAIATFLLAGFARAEAPPDQRTGIVIVPYDSTKPIEEQKPDQFYLPYERFLQLWDAAKQHRAGPVPERAAFPYALTAARYDGVQGDRSVAFTGKLDVTTTNDAWVKVPMAFKGAKIGGLKIDGTAAVFDGQSVVIEKPGRHMVEVAFEIPLAPGAKEFGWGIPRTSATLVTLTLLEERSRATITAGSGIVESAATGSGIIERIENGRKMVIAALGSTEKVQVELQEAAAASRVTEPAVASIVTRLAVRPGAEEADVRFAFSFPGARQDRFVVYLENGLILSGLDAVNLKSWKLAPDAGRQALEITLNEPAAESFSFTIQAQRAAAAQPENRVAPVFSAAAKRVEYASTAIFSDHRLEIDMKPAAGQRQIPLGGSSFPETRPVAAYAGGGKLAYSVKVAAPKKEARVDYAYQVNRRKIELMASFQFFANGDDLSTLNLTLPAQFEVQAVESEQLQDWWRDGNALRLRFRGEPTGTVPLVVYLVRRYAAAPTELDVRPLTIEGFKRVSGEAVIAAHKGVDVTMKLAAEGEEIAPENAAPDFQILPPLERKRGFAFKTQNFSAEVALATLPAKFNALWVLHAQAHEGWLALSAHARLTVRQGAIDRATFSLPKSAPEARIRGSEVRETRSRVEGDRRIYDVQFQNDVSEAVEFTFDFELPNAEEAVLPAIVFPEAQMTSGYVLTENLSEYEMRLKTNNVDPAPTAEIPFLPELSKGAGVFRVQPDWSVSMALDRLEKAESRAAFVAWAEMTSALRADGTEWHRASYRLQNRSLQFLPVRLPEGADLMSVSVAGQSVRADTGRVDGRAALLVPLIKTKPGDLSYDVELVYRIMSPLPGWRMNRKFQEPDLPGITIERTLWNVWLPDDRKLETSGGNMEPVLGDLNKTEKLEGKLQELRQLVTIASSSRTSEESRQNARQNVDRLKRELLTENRDDQFSETNNVTALGIAPTPTPGDELLGKNSLANQGKYVASKRKALDAELNKELQKLPPAQTASPAQPVNPLNNAQAAPQGAPQAGQGAAGWEINPLYLGPRRAQRTPAQPTPAAAVNLFFNDNVVLQQRDKGGGQSKAFSKATRAEDKDAENPAVPREQSQKDIVLQTARGNTLNRVLNKAGSGILILSGALTPAPINAPGAVPAAGAPQTPANSSTKSEAKRLQPTGRISLAVDFPTEGQIYHFKKVKADARLDLTVTDPRVFVRWWNLGIFLVLAGALYAVGFLVRRRSAARSLRSAPAH